MYGIRMYTVYLQWNCRACLAVSNGLSLGPKQPAVFQEVFQVFNHLSDPALIVAAPKRSCKVFWKSGNTSWIFMDTFSNQTVTAKMCIGSLKLIWAGHQLHPEFCHLRLQLIINDEGLLARKTMGTGDFTEAIPKCGCQKQLWFIECS